MPTNAEVIFNTVFNSTEHTERPKAVLAFMQANNGKRFTASTLKKMTETLGFEVTSRSRASMTYVVFKNGPDTFQNGDGTADMIVAYALKNIVIDAKFFEEHNAAYLKAADKRNQERAAALSNQSAIDELAAAVEAFKAAEARLKTAFVPFDVCSYRIETNLGLRKD